MISRICQIVSIYWHFDRHRRLSDPSRAAKADGDALVFDDHRDRAASMAVGQHARERGGVFLDVEVLERNMPPGKILTGG